MQSVVDSQKLQSSILKSFIVIVILLSSFMIMIEIYSQNILMSESFKNHYDQVSSIIKEEIEDQKNSDIFLLKRLLYSPDIIELLKNKQRDKIYEILKPKFDLLKEENPYLETMHIVDAKGRSFLRVHKKDEFGDYLGDIRPMIKEMITNKKLLFGFETGVNANVYRVMLPILDGDIFFGSIEIGVNPEYFIYKLNKSLRADGAIFIQKDNLKLFSRKSDFSINDYVLQGDISKDAQKILKLLPKNYNFQENTLIRDGFHFYDVHVHNLTKFDGSLYGHYVFTEDETDIYKNYIITTAYNIVALIFFMTLMFFIIKYYLNRFEHKITKGYNADLQKINFAKNYLSAVENSSSNIILSFVNDKLYRVNDTFLKVTGVACIEDFYEKYNCLSDIFFSKQNYLGNFRNEEELYVYLKNAPGKIHKVILSKEGKEHVFSVKLNDFTIDDKKRYMLTFSDITKFENMQKQFIEAQKIAYVASWTLWLEKDKLICSDEMYAIFEMQRETINSTKDFQRMIHPDDVKKLKDAYFESVRNKTSYQVTYRLLVQNGQKIKYIQEKGKHKFEDGKVISTGIIQDITEPMELREELKNQQELMISQSRHAAMGEMISMIAHQWRQPLSVIAMGANNIIADIHLESVTNETLMEASEEILEETQYLSQTIEDFRNFFKPSHGVEIKGVSDVFKDAYKIIGKSLANANIQLIENFKCDKVIETYARELMQVFINLLKNAQEALVEHKEQNRRIEVTCRALENKVVISFKDNAGGIKDAIINKIFDPYFSTKDKKVGTGLGLYMSKTIVEKHLQGSIRVFNQEDGVIFEIELPLKIGQWARRKSDG